MPAASQNRNARPTLSDWSAIGWHATGIQAFSHAANAVIVASATNTDWRKLMVQRVAAIVRETLTSGSGAALPSDVVVRAAALIREALLADAGTFRVAAVVREALVSETEAPPPSDEAPRFWVTVLA